jgi:hypothetical protein
MRTLNPRTVAALALVLAALPSGPAHAADPQQKARCATRLSIAVLGKSPSAALLAADDPQASVDAMLASPDFIERFATFVNREFNDQPGTAATQDSAYFLSRYVLTNNRPWHEMFDGKYKVDLPPGAGSPDGVTVAPDANGLGYFRSLPWLIRYAGNEPAGLKISTAYRIMNNVIGLKLHAVTNAPGADISVNGRMAQPCASCHFSGVFALDLVARTLTQRQGTGANITFVPSTYGPQQVLNATVADDAALVARLVGSDSFKFRVCRMAFEYLYGRAESQCEAPAFDACVAAFGQAGTMQAALASVAKDPGYCQ